MRKARNFRHKPWVWGFTIIELVVAITIALLLMAAAIPLFASRARTQEVDKEAWQVSSFVGRAKSYASYPEFASFDPAFEPTAYRVKKINATHLSIFRVASSGETVIGEDLLLTKSTIVNNFSNIDFGVYGGTYSLPGPTEIQLQLTRDHAKTARVIVTNPGEISVTVP